jgi:signal peptidase II
MSTPHPPYARLLLAIVILSTCIGCDQATKQLASRELKDAPPKTFLGGVIRLEYALNSGGFLSLGGELPKHVRTGFFVGFNVLMMLAICGYLIVRRQISLLMFVAILYFLAGGVGNLIDRVTNDGLVIDFLNIGIGPLRTGIFNVADMALVFGGAGSVLLASRRALDAGQDPSATAH